MARRVAAKHPVRYKGKQLRLDVPIEEFYTRVLLFFGPPKHDFRLGDYKHMRHECSLL